jgi:signal transduction histidine kinase/DNA-binding response OmpR family regulator/ligand-binding sensor domain-containing protein
VKGKLILLLLVVLFNHSRLVASDETIIIEDYSYKDGLTTSGVNSVLKDSKGFLWLCSNSGLFRFDGYTFRNINTLIKDNLNLETLCITEDTDHNFLIGTISGIYYYNTHLQRLFSLKLSLDIHFRTFKILFFNGRIWAATDLGLLIIASPKSFYPEQVCQADLLLPDPLHKRTPQDNFVNTLFYKSGASSLWVGSNGALYELDIHTLNFRFIDSYFQKSVRGISEYNHNIIVSSWDGGVFSINTARHTLESDPFLNYVNTIIGEQRVMSAILDNQNRLWVATFGNGLYIFESDKNKFSHTNYRSNQGNGVNLQSDFIRQMYIDNNGIAWLSMNQPALSKVYYQKSNLWYYSFRKQNNSFDSKEITSVNPASDKSKLWIATNGGGIYLFDIKTGNYSQFNDKSATGLLLQNNEVVLCYQDKTGNLWIVYRRIGLYLVPSENVVALLNGNRKKLTSPVDANTLVAKNSMLNSYITSFYEDSAGRLWVGGWGSLYIVELNKNELSENAVHNLLYHSQVTCIYAGNETDVLTFPVSPVFSILEVGKGIYWLGTLGSGIIQLDEISKNRFTGKQILSERIPGNNINCLYKDKSNHVWIGTNSGLFYWNSGTDSTGSISFKDGLSSEIVNNIVEDKKSHIWVSTSYGISEIEPQGPSVVNSYYSEKDNYNQFIPNAACISPDNMIWYSTNEALVKVDPEHTAIKRNNTAIYFTDVRINNNTVVPLEKYKGRVVMDGNINECKTIHVPYNHTLSIEFAALDFINPGQLLYKYRIGNSNEWIVLKSNQRSLSIPNLKQGEYDLNIMLANSKEKSNIRSIRINYLPPFWLSKFAYLVYFSVILFILLTYRKLLIQRILQRSIIEKERFERKKLEELDKMKSEFFSNISHEFRTPLSLIISPLEKLMNEKDITDTNRERIHLILKSSNRLLKLTNELMDFSKIEKKLLKPDFQLCEIVTLVNELCLLFNNVAYAMNLDFKSNCSFERLEIPIDRGMIEKVVLNLLSNAFKYTPANGMIMVNLTKSQEDGRDYVKLSVINTGEGINQESLGKIFDRYYQVSNAQNRNIEGTGVGLALVKSFVDLHQGKIEVKSDPDIETCFDIFLPVIQTNFKDKETIHAPMSSRKLKGFIENQDEKTDTERPEFQYKLLIIEDEDDIRQYLTDELSSEFKILSATNGEEGLKLANRVIPDLIITDLIMPVLSGLELCKKLKNQLLTSHIPVLILSAKANVEDQIEGLEMGADVFMVKPFNLDHLRAQIWRLLSFKETIYSRYRNENVMIPSGALSNKLDEEFMQKVITFINLNLTNSDLSVDHLAGCVSLSKVQTYRKIKAISGLSIVEFIRTVRLKKAAQMIAEGRFNFSEIAFETGFSTPSYFSKCFHDHFGKTPSEFAIDFERIE